MSIAAKNSTKPRRFGPARSIPARIPSCARRLVLQGAPEQAASSGAHRGVAWHNAEDLPRDPGHQVTSARTGPAGWRSSATWCPRLIGVALVSATPTPAWWPAIGAPPCPQRPGALPEPAAANLMAAADHWRGLRALLHSIYDQPDAESVVAQYDRVLDTLTSSSRSG